MNECHSVIREDAGGGATGACLVVPCHFLIDSPRDVALAYETGSAPFTQPQ